jgi:hypothetical protein
MSCNETDAMDNGDAISEASSGLDHNSSSGISTNAPSSDSSHDQDANARAAKHLGISTNMLKIVNCSRWMFLFCLFASAAALATAVYIYAHSDELDDFTSQVRSPARERPDRRFATTISRVCHLSRSSIAWVMMSSIYREAMFIDSRTYCKVCRFLPHPS